MRGLLLLLLLLQLLRLHLLGCRSRCRVLLDNLHRVVLLEIATELVVSDALLETDQDFVQLQVEVRALFQMHRKVVGCDNSLVDLLEEATFGGIIAKRVLQLLKSRRVLLDRHRNLLLLSLKGFVLSKMFIILCHVALKDITLA